jgi:hypothetical protein
MKRKNWRAPFYGKRPIEHIQTGYLALEKTRRYLESRMMNCGGIVVGRSSTVIGEVTIGEILAFDNFAFLQHEDADIIATMLWRVCCAWKLSYEEVARMTKSAIFDVVNLRLFPGEELLTRWRTILMIHIGVIMLNNGNEDSAYHWMRTSNLMLKNGATPFQVIESGELDLLYGFLKSHIKFMP